MADPRQGMNSCRGMRGPSNQSHSGDEGDEDGDARGQGEEGSAAERAEGLSMDCSSISGHRVTERPVIMNDKKEKRERKKGKEKKRE